MAVANRPSLLEHLHSSPRLMRTLAAVVIMIFATTILLPPTSPAS